MEKKTTTDFCYTELAAPNTCDKLSLSALKSQLKQTNKNEVDRIAYIENLISLAEKQLQSI